MKKPLKILLIALGSIVALIVILIVWFSIRYSTLTGQMNPVETGEINDTVYAVKDRFVNAYVFRAGDNYILFDACMSENNVAESFRDLDLDPDKVIALFLTHSDGDHLGATGLFKNAMVYMHVEEEQMVSGQTAKMGPIKYNWEFGEYKLLESNQVVDVSNLEVKVLHTPGHTPGSVCYVVNGDYLITGDNLIYSEGKFEHFIEAVNMDTDTQIESLKTLPDPSVFKYILTSHNGVHRVGE